MTAGRELQAAGTQAAKLHDP